VTLEQLDEFVWGQLSVRKHAAGQRTVQRITRRVVRKWPARLMQAHPEAEATMCDEIRRSIERSERQNVQMGIILTLVLGALIQEIIRAIVEYWKASQDHQAMICEWQREITK